jgi:hypothetical protein
MPGRNRRTIVSQAQRRYLHAAAGRGEIAESQVQDMEDRTPKRKLPKRSKSRAAKRARR